MGSRPIVDEKVYYPGLDGLRAVSILLLLTDHVHDRLWQPLRGYLGVTVFFVLSGFIITNQLLREQRREGRVLIRSFLIRRAYRILPLYYLALAVFAVGALVLGIGQGTGDFARRLPLFGSLNGELVGAGTFGHSWTLGVEEKFYVLWPMVAFLVLPLARHRLMFLGAFFVASVALLGEASSFTAPGYDEWQAYPALFLPIVCGCVVALTLNTSSDSADTTRRFDRRLAWLPVLAALAGATAFSRPGHVQVLFSVAATGLIAIVLVQRPGWLERPPLVHLGTRSYAIYLFHPIVLEGIDRIVAPGGRSIGLELLRFVLLLAGSLVIAEVLYRWIERPLWDRGREVATARRSHTFRDAATPIP